MYSMIHALKESSHGEYREDRSASGLTMSSLDCRIPGIAERIHKHTPETLW